MSWQPYDPCVCGCGTVGWKQVRRLPGEEGQAHVVGCTCRRHLSKRNVAKGKRGQARTHQNLGGSGFTPHHEESGLFYDLTVRPEVKSGQQVPASFLSFVSSIWFTHALHQSERAIPAGIAAKPSVSIDGRWLVVDLRPRKEARS